MVISFYPALVTWVGGGGGGITDRDNLQMFVCLLFIFISFKYRWTFHLLGVLAVYMYRDIPLVSAPVLPHTFYLKLFPQERNINCKTQLEGRHLKGQIFCITLYIFILFLAVFFYNTFISLFIKLLHRSFVTNMGKPTGHLLRQLRSLMRDKHHLTEVIQAYIVPSEDAHQVI